MENDKFINVITVVLRGLVVLPNTVQHFDISRPKSIKAVEKAMLDDEKIFFCYSG